MFFIRSDAIVSTRISFSAFHASLPSLSVFSFYSLQRHIRPHYRTLSNKKSFENKLIHMHGKDLCHIFQRVKILLTLCKVVDFGTTCKCTFIRMRRIISHNLTSSPQKNSRFMSLLIRVCLFTLLCIKYYFLLLFRYCSLFFYRHFCFFLCTYRWDICWCGIR